MWAGMTVSSWLAMLARNRFAVSPSRVGMVLLLSLVSLVNSFLWLLQTVIHGRRIARTRIDHEPIFIIGHWRTGTTLLHELMVLDSRHTYPTTYACFAANHFLVSGGLIRWWLRFLLPRVRPMDDMPFGWEYPQEDEFALCSMGIPTPYVKFAFPNRPPPYQEYLDLKGLSPRALDRWKRGLVWFLKCITLRDPRRIVLKSPPHTARIDVLLELFPNARFVHIVRDPYVIFPSTVRTWRRFFDDQGAQIARHEGLEDHVFSTMRRMYEAFEPSRSKIDPARFCEIRYEDLVRDPVGQMRTVYDQLGLDEFDKVLPAVEKYVAATAGYKTNRYDVSPELRDEITRRWKPYIERYGYAPQTQ
jgi:hypothetical protein